MASMRKLTPRRSGVPRRSSPDDWTMFNVFLEPAGVRPDTWPGKTAMGTSFVGRIARGDGGSVSVTRHYETMSPGDIKAPHARFDQNRALLDSGPNGGNAVPATARFVVVHRRRSSSPV